jgi:cell division protease FtsH
MEMFVGVGASRVRDLFATARKQSPAIVFIDEIDSIGRKRGAGVGGGHDERERIAFHESGHALLAYVLDKTDPLHKITIIPRGMALGVTMTLPEEDRHIMSRQHLEDSLCMRMGGRVAELLVYGDLSTGAADDLQRNTELARRMVREWGMSKEIGPMAWGSNNQVFLGEDLMHTRDYSDHTSQIIDDEVERILREQESRAIEVLTLHRRGLESLTRLLLENETIDGENGEPVHAPGKKTVSSLSGVGKTPPTPSDNPAPLVPPVPAAPAWKPPTLPAV